MGKAGNKRLSDGEKQTLAFGRAVYLLRIKAALSQEELALQSNTGRSYVGVLERGEKEPCLGVMFKLTRPLKTTLAELCGLAEQLYTDGYKPEQRNPRVR